MLYYSFVDTQEKKDSNDRFCELRDNLIKDGLSIYYDHFPCKGHYFTIRAIYYNKKIYIMKRCDKRCIEIIDLMEEYKKTKNSNSSVDK